MVKEKDLQWKDDSSSNSGDSDDEYVDSQNSDGRSLRLAKRPNLALVQARLESPCSSRYSDH